MNAPEHVRCRSLLAEKALEAGTEVDVSAVDPHHPMAESMTCPHGIRYWMLPTAAQLERWVQMEKQEHPE